MRTLFDTLQRVNKYPTKHTMVFFILLVLRFTCDILPKESKALKNITQIKRYVNDKISLVPIVVRLLITILSVRKPRYL